MATCKDCLHNAVCDMPLITDGRRNADNCGQFKNKADYVEVKHGEWIHKNGEMICSVCGEEALMDEVYYKSPFCPDCGADMRERRTDER